MGQGLRGCKLLIFGAAHQDVFITLDENQVDTHCNLDDKRCVIELSYGGKIPVKNLEFTVGGNGANVSIGTTRLGVDSVLTTEVGRSVLSDSLVAMLQKDIDTSFVTQTEGVSAGLGTIISYQGERTILSYYPQHEEEVPENITSEWAYLTSTGEIFENYYEKICEFLKEHNIRLIFNPGGRQIAKGLDWLKKYLEITDLLIVNREEAEKISGFSSSFGKEKELINKIKELGAKLVIITDARAGAFAFDGQRYLKCGIPENSPVIERTGAGDAFSTGVIAALLKDKSLSEGLIWGTLNSTSVVQYVGAIKGLLTEEGLEKFRQEWGKEFGVEEI